MTLERQLGVRLPRCICAALLFLFAPAAWAEEESLMLRWTAPDGCPSQAQVARATLQNLPSGEAERRPLPALVAEAVVSQRSNEAGLPIWHVVLSTEHGESKGIREIDAETCDGLAQATAVVLSLALLDLEQSSPAPGSEPEAPASAPPSTNGLTPESTLKKAPIPLPAAVSPPTKPTARQSTRPSRKSQIARFAAGAHLSLNAGVLPHMAAGGALSLAWIPGWFRLELDARLWAGQSETIEDTTAGARFALTTLGARACVTALLHRSVELAPCLGADLHLVSVQGFGADANYDTHATWPGLTAGGLVRTRLAPHVALRARVDAQVTPTQPRFLVEGVGTVHTVPVLGMVALFGAEVDFP